MKKLLIFVLSLAMLVSIVGCDSTSTSQSQQSDTQTSESSDKPYAGTKIVIGAEAGGIFTEYYKSITDEFIEMTGIEVEYLEVAHANTRDRFFTEAMAGTGTIDVYQLDSPWIAEFADYGFLLEVTEDMKNLVNDFNDFTESGLSSMSYQGKLYGLPFQYHTPVVFYRTDLFEKAGLEEPPKTWEEYREYAKILTDLDNGIYGTCLSAKAVPEPATHFLDKILQAGGHYMDPNTGEVIFDSQAVRDVFEWMYTIQHEDKSSPPGALGYENPDVYNLFLEGKVAMVSQWPYFYGGSQDPDQSNIVGKVGVAEQPRNEADTSALWAFGHGVASASKNKEAAWLFCVWSTTSEILKDFTITQTTPNPRKSAMEAVMESDDVTDDIKYLLEVLNSACEKAQPVTDTPFFPAVQLRLAQGLSNFMSGAKTMEQTIADTQADLEEILSGS